VERWTVYTRGSGEALFAKACGVVAMPGDGGGEGHKEARPSGKDEWARASRRMGATSLRQQFK